MLVPNLHPKVVPHRGSRLLPGLIVRLRGRLVAGQPLLRQAAWPGPSGPPRPQRRGPRARHPRPVVAPLPRRARLLALRLRSPARVLPEPVQSEPVQPQGTSLGARVACPAAGGLRWGTRRDFGRLARLGHDPRTGDGAGEGVPQRAVRRTGLLRGLRNTGRWWRLPQRRRTPAGLDRRRIADGLPANARSSKG